MGKKNKAKWIGSGIFTGICLCFTQAKSMELGGFDVEMGTGEGQEYPSDWWEEPETDGESGTEAGAETEQEYWEETPQENQAEDILTGEGGLGDMPVENPPAGTAENNQSVQGQENAQENHVHSEIQQDSQEENWTDVVTEGQVSVEPSLEENSAVKTPAPTVTPVVSETPTPSPILTPGFPSAFTEEASGSFPIFQDFSVFFHHLPVPQNQRKPYVEIQSEGQVGIVSVRHNHQECFWWREGNRLFWEMEPAEGENKIEILVITEDCRLVQMEPWVYSGVV